MDGDGHKDIISGCYRGDLYLFRNRGDGTFSARKLIRFSNGNPIHLGMGAVVFAADWDRDGDLDLLVGNVFGDVYFVPNGSGDRRLLLGAEEKLRVSGEVLRVVGREAAPCVADWDGDGNHDLLLGSGDGSVSFCRNRSDWGRPVLDPPVQLVPSDSHNRGGRSGADPDDGLGRRSKVCVADWNGDGLLDLLMGVFALTLYVPPELTDEEAAESRQGERHYLNAIGKLKVLVDGVRAEVRTEMGIPAGENPTGKLGRDLIARSNKVLCGLPEYVELLAEVGKWDRYANIGRQTYSYHGWVWVFLRK